MTHDELTPEQRIEIQDNILLRHLAKRRRERWEVMKGTKTPVPVKRFTMDGQQIDHKRG